MKKRVFKIMFVFALALHTICSDSVFAQTTAFPGAEGYGKYATGGRSGEVIEVTTLEDYLPNSTPIKGSFRWSFTQAKDSTKNRWGVWVYSWKPITVVFRVGGVIQLKDELRVQRDNVTIAGQTAPGDGICFRGATLNFSASNNVIVRYIRSRPGDELGLETSAFRIENGSNFIIDHCSFSWAIEETTHFSSNSNTTVQWCIISESLYNSIHKKGPRGYGTQWGGQYASYHHNLLADHNSRMPRINGSNANDKEALVDYRNNVNFNWGSSGAFYGGEWEGTGGNGFCHTNVVNNYFIPGPATTGTKYFAKPSLNRSGVTLDGYGKWFFNGNTMVGSDDKTNDNWLGVDASEVGGAANIRSDEEFIKSDGTLEAYSNYTQTAAEAYETIMDSVGAILPKRDLIDARVIAETKGERAIVRYTFTTTDGQVTPTKGVNSGLIDTQQNLVPTGSPEGFTPWDIYKTSMDAPLDTDHDGIPDIWEMAHGLKSDDSNDGKLIASNGYSNLENYLNLTDVTTSVGEIINPDYFEVFPNPVKDLIRINCSEHITKLELFDIFGKKLQSIEQLSGIISLPSGSMPKGIYLIKATSETNRSYFQKIIKQ